jgi:hypothetical protein
MITIKLDGLSCLMSLFWILDILDGLDKKAEHTPLQAEEINLKQSLNNRLAQLLRKKEIKWYQRAKVNDLLEDDSNTKYF